jgi:hypothetical protein
MEEPPMSDHHQHSSLLARPPKKDQVCHEQPTLARPRTRAEAFGGFMEEIFMPHAPQRDKKA